MYRCPMLKHTTILLLAVIVAAPFGAPATAQSQADIAKAKSGQSCTECNLFQAEFNYVSLKNVSFQGSRLRQSQMVVATMDGVDFSKTNLSVANLSASRFEGANFAGADLTDSSLVGSWFGNANFAGATLTGANLSGATMTEANGLTQSQLDKACGDGTTRLPGELFVPQC